MNLYREKNRYWICMRIACSVLRTKDTRVSGGKVRCRKIQPVHFRNTGMSGFPGMEMRREKCSPPA